MSKAFTSSLSILKGCNLKIQSIIFVQKLKVYVVIYTITQKKKLNVYIVIQLTTQLCQGLLIVCIRKNLSSSVDITWN